MDINTAIKRMIATGEVEFGSKKALQYMRDGKAKLVITSKNCPKELKEDVEHYAKVSETPAITYPGSSMELGEICGKPFLVSNIAVLNPGDVKIKELTEGLG